MDQIFSISDKRELLKRGRERVISIVSWSTENYNRESIFILLTLAKSGNIKFVLSINITSHVTVSNRHGGKLEGLC